MAPVCGLSIRRTVVVSLVIRVGVGVTQRLGQRSSSGGGLGGASESLSFGMWIGCLARRPYCTERIPRYNLV
jgi:hypothetical protein